MTISKVIENLRLPGFDALSDLFCFPAFFDSMMLPIRRALAVEVVSKFQITFKGKASRELETERTRKYVSIPICGATQPLGLRCGFETASG
jgi:hypothetical protein